MSKRGWFQLIVLIIVALAFLVACGGDPADEIIGEWSGVDESAGTIEFFEDGTVVIEGSLSGDYTLLDDSRIRLDGNMGSLVFEYEISGDRLTLSDDGDSAVFERVDD